MTNKTKRTKGRSKEQSKQKLLDAVGEILSTKGYSELKINQIAATAGLDKKLIYNYFGSKYNLLSEYIQLQDFWSNIKQESVPVQTPDYGKEFLTGMLLKQFEFVRNSVELQKVLLWRLSEPQPFLQQLTENQEKFGELLFQSIFDPQFRDKARDFRAVMAILVAGSYYLNLYASVNGSVFCGIDLNTDSGRNKIQQALSFLVDKSYEGLL